MKSMAVKNCQPTTSHTQDLLAKGMEVVFISGDRTEEDFKEYFDEMPWLAVDFAQKEPCLGLPTWSFTSFASDLSGSLCEAEQEVQGEHLLSHPNHGPRLASPRCKAFRRWSS